MSFAPSDLRARLSLLLSAVPPALDLEIVGTHEAHRKQGCATALLNRGNQLADEMDYPCYLNAATSVKHVYEKVGYVADLEAKKARSCPMVRKKKSDEI